MFPSHDHARAKAENRKKYGTTEPTKAAKNLSGGKAELEELANPKKMETKKATKVSTTTTTKPKPVTEATTPKKPSTHDQMTAAEKEGGKKARKVKAAKRKLEKAAGDTSARGERKRRKAEKKLRKAGIKSETKPKTAGKETFISGEEINIENPRDNKKTVTKTEQKKDGSSTTVKDKYKTGKGGAKYTEGRGGETENVKKYKYKRTERDAEGNITEIKKTKRKGVNQETKPRKTTEVTHKDGKVTKVTTKYNKDGTIKKQKKKTRRSWRTK